MNPYVEEEKRWPEFQHHLIALLFQAILPNLVDGYRGRVAHRTYTTREPLFTSIITTEHREEFLEIHSRTDHRLITLVDVCSPANRRLPEGREAATTVRNVAQKAGAHIVEIDLVLQGTPLMDFCRKELPEHDYTIAVMRTQQAGSVEVVSGTFLKRLPRFKFPLASNDRDCIVDLQSITTRALERCSFITSIDYQRDPDVLIPAEKRNQLDGLLRLAGARKA
jgi:hypothetical protein